MDGVYFKSSFLILKKKSDFKSVKVDETMKIKFIIQIFFLLSLAFLSLYFIPFSIQNTSRSVHSQTTKVIREESISKNEINKIKVYPELFKCDNYYDNSKLNESIRNNYNLPADERLHELRIVRGLVFYFPIQQQSHFEPEFRWVYRSWIEMQNHEPALWRTDLILFLDVQALNANQKSKTFFDQLNCKTSNLRNYKNDYPMCTILDYIPIKDRKYQFTNESSLKLIEPLTLYTHLFNDINVFDKNDQNLWKFYAKLKDVKQYNYLDSILVAFDGYEYFENKFNFLLRCDMDIFLTPLFGKWLPLNCNDFIVGRGAYSGDFNMKRLQKAAKNVKLEIGFHRNLGSTWFSTPNQFKMVSYLTLVAITYLYNEEFSSTERSGKLGVSHWYV